MGSVVVIGQPFWGGRIAAALQTPEIHARFVGARGYPALLARVPRREPVLLLRAGYRVGSPTLRGRAFDAYWRLLRTVAPRAAAAHYWLGTDALNTVEDAQSGALRRGPVRAAARDLHLADAPWLLPELAAVGLEASTAPVPQPYRAPVTVPEMPAQFTVLSYVPDGRFDFYGGALIIAAARRLPALHFDIVGGRGAGVADPPTNVTWHGWVEDMSARYAAASVVVRVPMHDGLGASVVEGLLFARHVVYTYEVPHTIKVSAVSADGLVDALMDLFERHEKGELQPNMAGRAYAKDAFDEMRLRRQLQALVEARL